MSTTVAKALIVLETIISAEEPISSTEVAILCGLTKSNAHRLLRVLNDAGYLIQDSTSKNFSPSLKIWEFGNSIQARLQYVNVAQGVVRWLADETGEAIHLAMYDNQEAVTILQVQSSHAVRAYTQVGGRAPAHSVATGKAVLAFQPESEIERVCRNLQGITPYSITKPQILRDQLVEIRETKIAKNNEEFRVGVRGIAVPLLDQNNNSTMSLGICGPSSRVVEDLDGMNSSLLLQAAEDLCSKLGLSPSPYIKENVARPKLEYEKSSIN